MTDLPQTTQRSWRRFLETYEPLRSDLHAELAVMPGSGHGAYLGAVDSGRPQHPAIAAAMIERFLAR